MSDYKACDNPGCERKGSICHDNALGLPVGWIHRVCVTGPKTTDEYDFCSPECEAAWLRLRTGQNQLANSPFWAERHSQSIVPDSDPNDPERHTHRYQTTTWTGQPGCEVKLDEGGTAK